MSRHSTKIGELCIVAASTQVTTGVSSVATAIPVDGSGATAKYVRVTAKGNAYIRPGLSGAVAAASSSILLIAAESIILNVYGMTHLAHIQETTASILQITPLEVG
jgi:hypothetical protein